MYCRVQGIFLFGVGFSRVVDFWVWGLRGDGFGVGSKKRGGGGGKWGWWRKGGNEAYFPLDLKNRKRDVCTYSHHARDTYIQFP